MMAYIRSLNSIEKNVAKRSSIGKRKAVVVNKSDLTKYYETQKKSHAFDRGSYDKNDLYFYLSIIIVLFEKLQIEEKTSIFIL
jgi:hypothetical protein